ncbi:MAG: PSD1 and planctomycete cytochrome C domain-containing protein [Gemmataceae bacterium]
MAVGLRTLLASLLVVACVRPALAQTLDFNRDIRPILSNNCFLCHGPDKAHRKGDLRLDTEKDAFAEREGTTTLVPGKPGQSELFLRLITKDPAKKMPPEKTNKHLKPEEIAKLKQWIEQGAKYQPFWSLISVRKPESPLLKNPEWVNNPIDAFVLARLKQEGLAPAPEADRRTLIRRLSFDLTGMPPKAEDVDAFLADTTPNAYEKLTDRLLATKHYGERMAMHWLDQVRYADTGGYHSDNHRDVAPYRDWVIDAFNNNMPFDRFSIEQLAGDLLPNATASQRIASGYNRLLQTTEEGGAQAKEYLAKYFADRVRNVSTVWLGLTLGCTECHNHPYDPFSSKEFYQFGAFFADIQEAAVGRQGQTPLPSKEQEAKLKQLEADIAALKAKVAGPEAVKLQQTWEAAAKAGQVKGLPKEIEDLVKLDAAKRNPKQKEAVTSYFLKNEPSLKDEAGKLAKTTQEKDALVKSFPQTLVSTSVAPRPIRVLPRGNWLDDSGELVMPTTPASLHPIKVEDPKKRLTRLDFAQWMVSRDNPLAARVFVNRIWMLMFGQGIVKTPDDFGSVGAAPTHPELLDWLSAEFQKDWDVKRLFKLIASSNAYRQSSVASKELRQRDPYNQWLARQGRFRLDAEMIRDNALAVSGLLVDRLGGPSVKPYQPAGYWKYLNFPTREWANDKGDNQYRRGLYTYWQRTFLHPSLLAFDAPTREECTAERPRSNTPQQALVLLNDPTYVEASRLLAEKIVRESPDPEARIVAAYRTVLQRKPSPEETKILTDLAKQHVTHYQTNANEAAALLTVGQRPAPRDIPAAELAAWSSVARAILNLHETITRN